MLFPLTFFFLLLLFSIRHGFLSLSHIFFRQFIFALHKGIRRLFLNLVSGSAPITKVEVIVWSRGIVWPRELVALSFTLDEKILLLRATLHAWFYSTTSLFFNFSPYFLFLLILWDGIGWIKLVYLLLHFQQCHQMVLTPCLEVPEVLFMSSSRTINYFTIFLSQL